MSRAELTDDEPTFEEITPKERIPKNFTSEECAAMLLALQARTIDLIGTTARLSGALQILNNPQHTPIKKMGGSHAAARLFAEAASIIIDPPHLDAKVGNLINRAGRHVDETFLAIAMKNTPAATEDSPEFKLRLSALKDGMYVFDQACKILQTYMEREPLHTATVARLTPNFKHVTDEFALMKKDMRIERVLNLLGDIVLDEHQPIALRKKAIEHIGPVLETADKLGEGLHRKAFYERFDGFSDVASSSLVNDVKLMFWDSPVVQTKGLRIV